MDCKNVIKILEKNDFKVVRIKGSHYQLKKDDKRVTIPFHKGDIPIKTLKSIEKQSGIKF